MSNRPRAIHIDDLHDLAILAEGFRVLTGQGVRLDGGTVGVTENLYVEVTNFKVKDIDGNSVGVFYFDDEREDFYFLPAKVSKA